MRMSEHLVAENDGRGHDLPSDAATHHHMIYRNPLALFLGVLLATTFLAGCDVPRDERQSLSGPAEDIVIRYVAAKLDAYVTSPRGELGNIPPEEAHRLAEQQEHDRNDALWSLDYGVYVVFRDITNTDDGWIVSYTENISLAKRYHRSPEEPDFSFGEECHRVIISHGVIAGDEYIDLDHPDFEPFQALPELDRRDVRKIPGDPYFRQPDASTTQATHSEDAPSTSIFAITTTPLTDYAKKWCASQNPVYPWYGDFSAGAGGDCTNFVSQCLEAGALPFVDNPNATLAKRKSWATYWWSNKTNRWQHSDSWSQVNGLRRHFSERSTTQTVHWVWENAHVGDVVFMDFEQDGVWNHACVVTTAKTKPAWQGGGFDLRVSCHSNSRCDTDFYSMAGNKGWWIQIVHMP